MCACAFDNIDSPKYADEIRRSRDIAARHLDTSATRSLLMELRIQLCCCMYPLTFERPNSHTNPPTKSSPVLSGCPVRQAGGPVSAQRSQLSLPSLPRLPPLSLFQLLFLQPYCAYRPVTRPTRGNLPSPTPPPLRRSRARAARNALLFAHLLALSLFIREPAADIQSNTGHRMSQPSMTQGFLYVRSSAAPEGEGESTAR